MAISKKNVLYAFLITFVYLAVTVYSRNSNIINSTFFNQTPLSFKVRLYTALFEGLPSTMTEVGFFTLLIIAILTGFTLVLVMQRILVLKNMGKVHIVAGGGSLLGLVSGGCASCGLPLLSLLGLTGSLAFLPFKGAELPYISIFLLTLSLVFLLKNNQPLSCSPKERGHSEKKI